MKTYCVNLNLLTAEIAKLAYSATFTCDCHIYTLKGER